MCMLWFSEEKEKDSIYIQRIMRENFNASPLVTESLATGYVTYRKGTH